MEKSQSNAKSRGVCEKIHKAVATNSGFRSIHRISRRSGSRSPGGSAAIKTKTQASLKKLVAPGQSHSHHGAEGNNIPILHNHEEFESSSIVLNGKEKPPRSGSNMILIEIHDQGVYLKPKVVKPPKPHMSTHEKMPKQKDQPASTTTEIMTKQRYDDGVEEGKKTQVSEHGAEKFTNYINYVRNKLRTTSSVVEEKTEYDQRPPTRTPTRRDSFNDRVANFINRARNNIRTTSN